MIEPPAGMTRRQFEALALHREGWPYSRIGEMMGIAKQAAHQLARKARKHLREHRLDGCLVADYPAMQAARMP